MPKVRKPSEYSENSNRSSAVSEALSGLSIDDLTGKKSSGKLSRNSSITKAYINDAFSFLEADEYNPYKKYADIPEADEKNIISLNLDSEDHTKKTALHLTSKGQSSNPGYSGNREASNKTPKQLERLYKRKSESDNEKKGPKKPLPAPYITSIPVNSTSNKNSHYVNNIKRAPAPVPVERDNKGVTNQAFTPDPDNNNKPQSVSNHTNGGAVPVRLSSSLSTKTYDTVDGNHITSNLSSSKDSGDSSGFCSKNRLMYTLVIVLIILIIAGLVGGLVYVFVSRASTDDAAPLTESNMFNGTLRYNASWSDDLYNKDSPRYREIEQTALNQLGQVLQGSQYGQNYSVNITDIRPGSILVLFELLLRNALTSPQNLLNVLQQGFTQITDTGTMMLADPLADIILTAMDPLTTTTSTTTSTGTTISSTLSTSSSTSTSTSSTTSTTASTSSSQTTSGTASTQVSSTTGTTTKKSSTLSTPSTISSSTVPSIKSTSTTSSSTSTSTTASTTSTTSSTTTSTTPSTTSTTTTTTPSTTTSTSTQSTTAGSTLSTTTLVIPPLIRTTPLKTGSCVNLNSDNLLQQCEINGYTQTGSSNPFWGVSENVIEAANRIITFKNIAATNCYKYALEFLCATYFPKCTSGKQLIYPCRSYCQEFLQNCSYPINCRFMPKDDSSNYCIKSPLAKSQVNSTNITTPGCTVTNLLDFTPQSGFLCGNGKCVSINARCDGTDHCGDMSDELACFKDTDSKLQCNFEDPSNRLCKYSQDTGDYFDWLIRAGSTSTIGTGPLADHTTRVITGHYLLAEASGRYYLDTAQLISPGVEYTTERCLRFYYHMYGEDVGWLKVKLQLEPDSREVLIWERHRSAGNRWRYGYVTLPANQGMRVKFQVVRGTGHIGDIAIDDITALQGACPAQQCEADEFLCAKGQCLSKQYVCDGANDCGDFSDERNCKCTEDQWQCAMGLCIDRYKRCNEVNNCPDLSDEKDCGVCKLGEVLCPNTTKCIQYQWVCDGESDCKDGWDEKNCQACTQNQFRCTDYGCVDSTSQCDGVPQCNDASDEHKCVRESSDQVVEAYRNNNFLPVCAAGFPDTALNSVCISLGKGKLDVKSTKTVQSTNYLVWTNTSGQPNHNYLLKNLLINTSCPGDQVLSVRCHDLKCGLPAQLPQTFVIQGNHVAKGQWPWHGALLYNNRHKCNVVLISENHVLTAAHCFDTVNLNALYLLQVVLGAVNYQLNDAEYRKKVTQVQRNSKYVNHYSGDDIAVLTLESPVTYNDFVKPICLPDKDDFIPIKSRCYASGFGYVDYAAGRVPLVLQDVKMKLVTQSKCKVNVPYVKDSMLCAGYDSGALGVCIGDSGGPLMCQNQHGRWDLVGITSFVFKPCVRPEFPSVYTKTQAFLNFIQQAQACQFLCKNGNCLLAKSEVCNGQDDCGDLTDELPETCSPSIDCMFESDYLCGYSSVGYTTSIKPFTRHTGMASTVVRYNNGAIVDKTFGNNTGSYMLSGKGTSILLSPVFSRSAASCLRFSYNMRGKLTGVLKVFQLPVSSDILHPRQLTSLDTRAAKFNRTGHQGDLWLTTGVDIQGGRSVVGFEAVSVNTNDYAIVSIDNVTLHDGACEKFVCPDFGCTNNRYNCIPPSQQCNYQAACIQQSDENQCSSVNKYFCDFEQYGSCLIEQDYLDTDDWEILQPFTRPTNRPAKDHTLNNDKGHYMYWNMLPGILGDSARLKLAIKTPNTKSCLSFYYMMDTTGAVRVTLLKSSDIYDVVFVRSDQIVSSWKWVELTLVSGVRQIIVDAIAGRYDASRTTGYIALDDLQIENKACSETACSPVDSFLCTDKQCISKELRCDGYVDCDDQSDEVNCKCDSDAFVCDDGLCLQSHVRCNNVDNCLDSSDEYNCERCDSETEYQCNDGTCKLGYTWCDGVLDCKDGEDETPGCQCRSEQYKCDNGHCITGARLCDGYIDCRDGSDEKPGCTCDSKWHFTCNNTGACIDKTLRCNLKDDCSDGSDEWDCKCDPSFHFTCTNGRCIQAYDVCNGVPDCQDGSDEQQNCSCYEPDDFRCVHGGCLARLYVCDGKLDCVDNSDEMNCSVCQNDPANYFTCDNHICVNRQKVCDRVNDCQDLSDEKNCTCTVSEFKCDNGLCIDKGQRCDHNDNCGDESDEKQCDCQSGEWRCSDGGCIQSEWVCDSYKDCMDGSDENNCGSCPSGSFQCHNYSCISENKHCDGIKDCPSGNDELGCVKINTTTDIIYALHAASWLPVCYNTWEPTWSEDICQSAGQGALISTSAHNVDSSTTQMEYLIPSNTSLKFHSGVLKNVTNSCKNNKIVKIKCQSKECGKRKTDKLPVGYIVGGDIALDGAWPWNGGLYYAGTFVCSVVLIDDQYAIGVRHCFVHPFTGHSTHNLPYYYSVQLGSNLLNAESSTSSSQSSVQVLQVESITIHPNYSITPDRYTYKYNDIAVIKFTKAAKMSDYVNTMCLPEQVVESSSTSQGAESGVSIADQEVGPGLSITDVCYVAAWGYTYIDRQRPATNLREVRFRMWSVQSCAAEVYWGSMYQKQSQLCAGFLTSNIALCIGDSGAPLMCRDGVGGWKLAGITSSGTQDCGYNLLHTPKPAVFTRVSHYTGWIKDVIAKSNRRK